LSDVDNFCRELWPSLATSLGLLCHDQWVGEELAQETLARVWARWDHVAGLEAPEAWAYRVGVNLSRSRYRRSQAERRALRRLGRSVGRSLPSATDGIAVRDAVVRLPDRQRAALVLRYFADLPIASVAEVLGCAEGTVKSLTSQAIHRLRAEFDVAELEDVSHD
jgi:RNA polymerase sigma factor (sigma-70 family)